MWAGAWSKGRSSDNVGFRQPLKHSSPLEGPDQGEIVPVLLHLTLARCALHSIRIHAHQRCKRVYVPAMRAGPGWRRWQSLSFTVRSASMLIRATA